MNYEPFTSGPDWLQQTLQAIAKLFTNLLNEIARMRRQFGASHEAIEETVRSEGMGTREAFTMGWSSLQDDQRLMGRRVDGGLAEILEVVGILPEMKELLQQLMDRIGTLEAGQISMASVLAYHARLDPRDYEQDEDDLAGLD
ncbi:hypothetical protein [Cyanobium sp. CH-040]|uniref:hypothetical protein n=1 Tax=Cyanobium sp. CH-040 TaxID=2823708 RepID=UPI0020CBE0BB|nr:hypothetical protein [Cyanobium sp. CH-040]MCP9928204.1 hypothetical protein [Cyanobium sp. CH-040]